MNEEVVMTTFNASEFLHVLGAAHFTMYYNLEGKSYHPIDRMKLHIDYVLYEIEHASSSTTENDFTRTVERTMMIRNKIKAYLDRERVSRIADLDLCQHAEMLMIATSTWLYGDCGVEVMEAFSSLAKLEPPIHYLPQLTNSEFFQAYEEERKKMWSRIARGDD
jgi:hypothetical protein